MLPGTDVEVTLLRDGKEQTVDVPLGELQAADREGGGSGRGSG